MPSRYKFTFATDDPLPERALDQLEAGLEVLVIEELGDYEVTRVFGFGIEPDEAEE